MGVLSRGIGPDHTYEKVTTYGTPNDCFCRMVEEYETRNGQVFVRRYILPWPAASTHIVFDIESAWDDARTP